jgi:hypothetical protein
MGDVKPRLSRGDMDGVLEPDADETERFDSPETGTTGRDVPPRSRKADEVVLSYVKWLIQQDVDRGRVDASNLWKLPNKVWHLKLDILARDSVAGENGRL